MFDWIGLTHTRIEEHVSDGSSLLVYLERMPSQYDPLRDDARRIRIHEGTRCDKLRGCVGKKKKKLLRQSRMPQDVRNAHLESHPFPSITCTVAFRR